MVILLDKVTWITEKTRRKIKTIIKNYEKGECVRVSNHVQFLKNTDYIIYILQQSFKKESRKMGNQRNSTKNRIDHW